MTRVYATFGSRLWAIVIIGCAGFSLAACGGGSSTLAPMPAPTPTAGPGVTALTSSATGVSGSISARAPHATIDLVSQSLATPSGTQVRVALTASGVSPALRPSSATSNGLNAKTASVALRAFHESHIVPPRLQRVPGVMPARLPAQPRAAIAVGTVQNFYVSVNKIGQATTSYLTLPFTLGATTANTSIWFQSSIAAQYAAQASQIGAAAERALTSDEQWLGLPALYTNNAVGLTQGVKECNASGTPIGTVQRYIAPPSTVDILIVDQATLGTEIGGFFNPGDLSPQSAANCAAAKSNEAATITIGLDATTTNLDYYFTEIPAHEGTHLIQYVNGAITLGREGGTPGVTEEGLAQLSQDVVLRHPDYVFHAATTSNFLPAPQNYAILSMNGLENGAYSPYRAGNYGAAYLLVRYVADRYGLGFGRTFILNDPYTGPAQSFAAFASAAGATSFQQLFGDFATTLAASTDPISFGSPYAFTSLALNGTYTGPSTTSTSQTVTYAGIAPAGLLPSATSTKVFPGGIAILEAPSSIAGATFSAIDPTGSLQLGGTIVSY